MIAEKLEELARGKKISYLNQISNCMSEKYRGDRTARPVSTRDEVLVYAIVRMPATYCATRSALDATMKRAKMSEICSVLDVGGGTGASSLAVIERFENCKIDFLEREQEMIMMAKSLLSDFKGQINYIRGDILSYNPNKKYDLVIASYVLNELDKKNRQKALIKLLSLTKNLLLIIESGTPDDFALGEEDKQFLDGKIEMVAPCPSMKKCKLEQDYCNFSCRIDRSRLHKLVKGVESPFEDEKFSYHAYSFFKPTKSATRIIRKPIFNKKFIKVKTCSDEGISERVFTKTMGETYKKLRHQSVNDLIFEGEEND